MTASSSPAFLVVDCYAQETRQDMAKMGVLPAGTIYSNAIKTFIRDCAVDIIFAADSNSSLAQYRNLSDYQGCLWTGSSLMVDDGTRQVLRQIDLMKELFEKNVPIFGSCWALQIAAVSAGGSVRRCLNGYEFGIARKIQLSAIGQSHPMFLGKKPVFESFAIHRDEVEKLPQSSLILASNEHTNVQAAIIHHANSSFWGVQYHPEFDFAYMHSLTLRRKDNLIRDGFFSNEEECKRWAQFLLNIHHNPKSKSDLWFLGVDEQLVNPYHRMRELGNWLNYALSRQSHMIAI
ncbi:MAG: type 1 glutamine amidotransferase [Pseudomonadota bacterium]